MGVTENDLLDFLAETYGAPPFDEGQDVCAATYAARRGIHERTAAYELVKLEAKGVLVSHDALRNGRRVKAYRKA